MSNFLGQLTQMAPQMNQMAEGMGLAVGQIIGLLRELVRVSGAASGYQVVSGTTADAYGANQYLLSLAPRVLDITVEDQDCICALSYDGTAYASEFVLKAGIVYSMSMTARGVRFRSRTAGAAARFQVVAQV